MTRGTKTHRDGEYIRGVLFDISYIIEVIQH
jgi:hypothetical protein